MRNELGFGHISVRIRSGCADNWASKCNSANPNPITPELLLFQRLEVIQRPQVELVFIVDFRNDLAGITAPK